MLCCPSGHCPTLQGPDELKKVRRIREIDCNFGSDRFTKEMTNRNEDCQWLYTMFRSRSFHGRLRKFSTRLKTSKISYFSSLFIVLISHSFIYKIDGITDPVCHFLFFKVDFLFCSVVAPYTGTKQNGKNANTLRKRAKENKNTRKTPNAHEKLK